MAEEIDVSKKREELKHQLATGEYKTLIDVMLDGMGRSIQKLTRGLALPPFWFSALMLTLVILLISVLLSILLGEFQSARREFIPIEFMIAGLLLAIWIGLKIYIDSFFAKVHDYILDGIEAEVDLADLQRWLVAVSNLKRPLVIALVYGVVQGLNRTAFHSDRLGDFIGIGPMIFLILIHFFSVGIGIYYFFLFIVLPMRLGKYHFKLYAADPSSSEIIDQLSDVLSNFVYLVAVINALGSLLSFLFAQWYWLGELMMIWIPLILLFILNQYNLAKIITRSKWKTLNAIQEQVETLQKQETILGEETLAHIDKLMDYHDRIKATRNSALDFRAGLNFANSLLLPLFAFVLGNLNEMRDVF